MLLDDELIVDNFAGGGGASTGLEMGLSRPVDIAINHDEDAIAMHKMNHPETEHYCESVWDVDPISACKGRPVGLAWFSPDCKHFSKAKGSVPVDKAIRGLAWIAIKWTALVPVRMFMLENVDEFLTWGPVIEGKPCKTQTGIYFEGFKLALSTGLPAKHVAFKDAYYALFRNEYDVKRKLAIYKAMRRGLGYDIQHRVLSACDYGAPTTRKRLFIVGRNDGLPVIWPTATHGDNPSLTPYRTAADIIDWSIPVRSIFNRKKPLATKTLTRIAKGLEKYAFCDNPFTVPQSYAVSFTSDDAFTGPDDATLAMLRTKLEAHQFILDPSKSPLQYTTSHITKMRGTNIGHGTDEPVHTITAGGLHLGEVRAFIVKYYGTNVGHGCNEPLQTITTKDRFALVIMKTTAYAIIDIGLRMLAPHELFAAQGFPKDYQFAYLADGTPRTKKKQVERCGNVVCPPVAAALVKANTSYRYEMVA